MLLYKANGNDCVVTNYSTNPLITRKNGRKTTHRGMIKVKECVPALACERFAQSGPEKKSFMYLALPSKELFDLISYFTT